MTSCIFLHLKFDQIFNLNLTFFDIKDSSTDFLSDLLFSLKQMSTSNINLGPSKTNIVLISNERNNIQSEKFTYI
jgi:hypothetical protein